MKKTILPILALLFLAGCNSTQKATDLPERPEISCEVFQKVKGCKSIQSNDEL